MYDFTAAGPTADRLLQNEQVPVTVVLQPLPHQDAGKGKGASRAAAAEHKGKQVRWQGHGLASAAMLYPSQSAHQTSSSQVWILCTSTPGGSKTCARLRSAAPSVQSVPLTVVLQKLAQHLTFS